MLQSASPGQHRFRPFAPPYFVAYTTQDMESVSVSAMMGALVNADQDRGRQLWADVRAGDLLAVPGTGAYCRSMASNYNHVPRPPVVAVRGGASRVIVRRETEADLLALDVG